ncbi:MAG: YesL family protein [Oliverpabstia sp.]
MGIFAPDGKLARFLNCLGNLIVLNILTLICCIPVITAGASMTALYTMVMRMVRKEDGKIIKGFFHAFKDNFRQATILWLIFGGLIGFMTFDIWLLRSITGTFGTVYRVVLFVIILIFAMVLIHIFAVLARFDNTIKNTAKNALLFCVGKLPQAILMLILTLIPAILLTISYRFVSVDFLIGLSGPAYLAAIYFADLFKNYEEEETVE